MIGRDDLTDTGKTVVLVILLILEAFLLWG